ncbi:MAG: hypothetical protein Q4E41_05880 [Bacteroidales bacterium]|nr:hypothetical protein [Bacteroidales bacterium]
MKNLKKKILIGISAVVLLAGGTYLGYRLAKSATGFTTIEGQNPDNLEAPVFITKYGSRYHTETCRHIQHRDSVKVVEREDAESVGRTPCHTCHP